MWQQDDVTQRQVYWLELPDDVPIQDRQNFAAALKDRTIALEGDVPQRVCLRLSDCLLDLDLPMTVTVNGREAFMGKAARTS